MAKSWKIPEIWRQQTLCLSAWQAEPVSQATASEMLEGVRVHLQHAYHNGSETPILKIMEMTALFQLGQYQYADFNNLMCTLDSEKYRALACLVYGQLLVSQKYSGAHEMLKQGFDRIQPWLQADEYFTLLKRHQQLASLALSQSGSDALSLQELLNEAAVVRKLQGEVRDRTHRGKQTDTLG